MGKVLVLLMALGMVASLAGAAQDSYSVNGSEPAFLKGIGPQDDRADNPAAAAVTVLGVALVILRGLHRYAER